MVSRQTNLGVGLAAAFRVIAPLGVLFMPRVD